MINIIKMFRSVPFRSVPFRSVPFRSVPTNFLFCKFLLKIISSQAVCRGRHPLQVRIILPLFILTLTFFACNSNDGGPEYFKDVKAISAGYDHTAVIKTDGTLWVWGSNLYGKLANGESGGDKYSKIPIQVTAEPGPWESVSTRVYHTVALKADDTIWSWGEANGGGNLGTGTVIGSKFPVQEYTGGNDWRTVAAGSTVDNADGTDTVAIKSNGELWAWGHTVDEITPVNIGIGFGWKAASAGDNHIVAIRSDGTLWDLVYSDNKILQQITASGITNNDWEKISAGGNHTVAIKKNGTLWAWGDNSFGQLGYDTFESIKSAAPCQIGKDTNWLMVSAGDLHTMAIKRDGSLWAWGSNASGQLGSNTETYSPVPIRIGNDKWIQVSAGYRHTVAIKSNGILYAWGDNRSGQLGDGTTRDRSTPTKVTAED